MTMTRWDSLELEWPERLRRWLDLDSESDKVMRVEELHEDDAVIVRAEMPGLDPDQDVEVSIEDGVLRIAAHREERTERQGRGGYRSEFRYGEFTRNLPLPKGVDQAAVTATYRDGILEVRVPCHCEPTVASTKVKVLRS